MEESIDSGNYVGPAYVFPSSVENFKLLPRFGHGSDITVVFSSNRKEQVDYAAGLVALFVFLLMFFLFWTMMIVTFKVMGPANAGFLSGHHFVVPDPVDDVKNIRRRPFRVRLVFLVATAFLMLFTFLLVGMGLTNVNNATRSMSESLLMAEGMLAEAEVIAQKLENVGTTSIEIRDSAVAELAAICPANPDITDMAGIDIVGIASQAQSDLTMLANFIQDGLDVFYQNIVLFREYIASTSNTIEIIEFWDWHTKLLFAGLFVLPSLLAMGVGLVMLNLDIKPYQKSLTYLFIPLFTIAIIASYVICCAMLPFSAATADACSGGGDIRGGPDDSVLTVYRNFMGDDTSVFLKFLGYYTQQCDTQYYPFDFLSIYLSDLDKAIASTNTAVSAIGSNQDLLEAQCGRNFDDVLGLVKKMNSNLLVLEKQVDMSLDLVKCENINNLYVKTIHETGCTYSVDAMAWIFASTLIISVCGLIMIMLRSACYPAEYLDLSESWRTKPTQTKSASRDSNDDVIDDVSDQRARKRWW